MTYIFIYIFLFHSIVVKLSLRLHNAKVSLPIEKKCLIKTLAELQPLLEQFYQLDIVMNEPDWMNEYEVRFEPFLDD